MRYTIQDYSDIVFAGYEYSLPDNINSIIQFLTLEFGSLSPTIDNASDNKFKKTGFFNIKNKKKIESIDDVWEKTKAFKATVIEKKEGIEKSINDIRICLNKISNKNYETHRDTIIEYIEQIRKPSDDSSDEEDVDNTIKDINLISTAIFDIASTNKFYSELYARLYKELLEKFPMFSDNMNSVINSYQDDIHKIQLVDPNENYDKFCDNNKLNDKRKALSAFIVNLMKQSVIDKTIVSDIILYLQDIVIKNADIHNMVYEIEEITENLFIFITLSMGELNSHESWEKIKSNIVMISNYKAKEHLSISSRAIFKYMDILDKVKN
jgi:hypothetical protein